MAQWIKVHAPKADILSLITKNNIVGVKKK